MIDRLTIRRATKRDGPSLLRLLDALADYERLPRPKPAAKRRLLGDAFGRNRRFDTLLAVSGKTPVGYAIVFETYSTFLGLPTLYLEDLFVLPDRRGEGIGKRLFRSVVADARRRGCGRVEWVVLDWNTDAIGFYKKLGATRQKSWHVYRLVP